MRDMAVCTKSSLSLLDKETENSNSTRFSKKYMKKKLVKSREANSCLTAEGLSRRIALPTRDLRMETRLFRPGSVVQIDVPPNFPSLVE